MEPLLDIQGLTKHFFIPANGFLRRGYSTLKAVDGVSFSVAKGTCFGIAGESGSGKTTINKLILLAEKPTAGKILFESKDITAFNRQEIIWYRTRVQPVFQDASSSLDPNMRIIDIVSEPLDIQQKEIPRRAILLKAQEILRLVGIGPESLRKYPHELSGGQKQRVAIARAIILDPALVILDEPVSALDVSIRAQILNLLADIQEQRHLTYLVIAHDLAMLRQITTHVAVMYLGKIMETGETEQVFDHPSHPYTKGLLQAVPRSKPGQRKERPALYGEIPDPLNPPMGCRFGPRCEHRIQGCDELDPPLMRVAEGHFVACARFPEGGTP
ncbi:MAG TPA: ABC transporter ATP-binding protein [Syntrophorhabdaceae bacterium]|nr:ABC transporter ATP-binding protein [Syntrophorhabdaceae bacterium]